MDKAPSPQLWLLPLFCMFEVEVVEEVFTHKVEEHKEFWKSVQYN